MSHPQPEDHFEPDEPIYLIEVQLHTADVSDASTDSDIFVELFDPPPELQLPGFPFFTEIDTSGHNDFEKGGTDWYILSPLYSWGKTISDIVRFRLYKGDDWGSDWGFGWVHLRINSKPYYTSPKPPGDEASEWLTDGDVWSAPEFPLVDFVAPTITDLGLRDAGPNEDYKDELHATGGRAPISWTLKDPDGDVFSNIPTLTPLDPEGRSAKLEGHTININLTRKWRCKIILQDADLRTSEREFNMRLVITLPPPEIRDFNPTFGWPGLSPAAPIPVVVTINSVDDTFDSRTHPDFPGQEGSTEFFFRAPPDQSPIKANVLECTSAQARVEVPNGATSGRIVARTAFGDSKNDMRFTAHPNGYRFISGFSFTNRTQSDNSADGFPDTFGWARYEETFGTEEMWLNVWDQNVMPNPASALFYLISTHFLDSGCCHGFCLFSLQLRQKIMPKGLLPESGKPYPLLNTLHDLQSDTAPSEELSNYVQSRQLVVWSDEALTFFFDKVDEVPNVAGDLCKMSCVSAVADTHVMLADQMNNPRMIAFAEDCSPIDGHVVVPYNIEGDPSTPSIRVYDPNRPANSEVWGDRTSNHPEDTGSVFMTNISDGDWDYAFNKQPYDKWHGLYMFTIPLKEPGYGDLYDWSLPGPSVALEGFGIFMFGSAGCDESAEIIQIKDQAGKMILDQQQEFNNRKDWPDGVRPFPQFSTTKKTKLFALTKAVPLLFTVKPKDKSGGMFCLVCGSSKSISIESIIAPVVVENLPVNKSIRLSPVQSKTSAIMRLSKRISKSESLSYAIRVHDLLPAHPVEFAQTADELGIILKANNTPLKADIEVMHSSRIGELRILQYDGIDVPAGAAAKFEVSNFEDLGQPGKTPVTLTLDLPPHTAQVKKLGQNVESLALVCANRVIVPPPKEQQADVEIDVSKSESAFPNQPMNFYSLGHHEWKYKLGKLTTKLGIGTHMFRIQAEDQAGHKSFPRIVMVTIPKEGESPSPLYTLFSENAKAMPGTSITLPLGTYVIDKPVNRIIAEIYVDNQVTGLKSIRPKLGAFKLSSQLQQVGATANMKSATPKRLRYEIRWSKDKPLSGNIRLGSFKIEIPTGVSLGSTFIIRFMGSIISSEQDLKAQNNLNGLPAVLKIWGGNEPRRISIQGPKKVEELKKITLNVIGQGLTPSANNVGWWVEKVSGLARADQDPTQPFRATVTGLWSGWVRVRVVVGTQIAQRMIRVKSTTDTNFSRNNSVLAEQALPIGALT